MPKRSAVLALPDDVKSWLDRALAENGFGGYELLAEELRRRGYEISKSAIHRYGQKFEERLASLKLASEQARAIVDSAPDKEGAMNEALMRLVQEKLFGVLQEIQVDPSKLNIAALAKSIAELGRASVTQKKFAEEVREQERQRAAELVDEMASAQGLGEEQARFWREKVLGVR
jgi:hypothetical protein